jgi:sarcosine oxidase subunit beta
MGFSGHGFCLGPVSGRILADLVMGRAPAFELGAFALGRFAAAVAPAGLSLHG